MTWKKVLKAYKPLAHGVQGAQIQGKEGAEGLDPTSDRERRTRYILSEMNQDMSPDFKRIEQIEDKEERQRQFDKLLRELGLEDLIE